MRAHHLLLALTMLAACSSDKEPDTGETVCSPALPQVERLDVPAGYRVLDAPVDAPWLDEARTVPVGLWYPTEETEGEAAVYIELWEDPSSLVDAAFADPAPGCKLPLLVYSHGSQSWGGSNATLFRHLVAQGWVAAAPDHVHNTLFDNEDPRPISFSQTRVADIEATIAAIDALPEDDPLYQRVDTSRILVMGHSFGGQTAWLFAGPTPDAETIAARCEADTLGCSEAELAALTTRVDDPRIVGVMPMDGFADTDLVAAEGWESASVPILYLNRSGDTDSVPFETASAADVTWGRFEGACHETFTDAPVPCDTFDQDEGHDIVAQYLSAFAATRVLGAEGAPYEGILDGSTVVDSRVTLQRSR